MYLRVLEICAYILYRRWIRIGVGSVSMDEKGRRIIVSINQAELRVRD